ncbi:MAG: DUF1048 domain-containing protein [Peptococcaceae bacterium]|nr:DUF1048 domain-containing protein [Peptococcaceae bacterium]
MSKRVRVAKKEIKKMEAELHPEYAQFVQQMKDYLRFADVGADQKTLIYHDIVNMLLDGQARGQSVQEIIGDDYRVFCDEVIAAVPRLSPVLKWVALVQQFLKQLFVFLGIWFILELVNNLNTLPEIPFTVGSIWGYIGLLALACYASWHNTQLAFSDVSGRLIGGYILLFLGIILVEHFVNDVFSQCIVSVNIAALIGIMAAVGLGWLITSRVIDKRLV